MLPVTFIGLDCGTFAPRWQPPLKRECCLSTLVASLPAPVDICQNSTCRLSINISLFKTKIIIFKLDTSFEIATPWSSFGGGISFVAFWAWLCSRTRSIWRSRRMERGPRSRRRPLCRPLGEFWTCKRCGAAWGTPIHHIRLPYLSTSVSMTASSPAPASLRARWKPPYRGILGQTSGDTGSIELDYGGAHGSVAAARERAYPGIPRCCSYLHSSYFSSHPPAAQSTSQNPGSTHRGVWGCRYPESNGLSPPANPWPSLTRRNHHPQIQSSQSRPRCAREGSSRHLGRGLMNFNTAAAAARCRRRELSGRPCGAARRGRSRVTTCPAPGRPAFEAGWFQGLGTIWSRRGSRAVACGRRCAFVVFGGLMLWITPCCAPRNRFHYLWYLIHPDFATIVS